MSHIPALLDEVLAALAPRTGGLYVDCTFGRGGHARALLARVGPGGRVLALDRDPAAVAVGRELAAGDARLSVVHAPFSRLAELAARHGVHGRVDGVLFDLGVSSPQLDDPGRGFSFREEGPLDMRMDPTCGPSAAEWLARVGERQLAEVLARYGEERHARRLARAIVAARRERPIETTRQLAELVARASPARERGQHPATRTFQALRIEVNRELDELAAGLEQAAEALAPGGRLAVISFHSLEDRLVKRFIRERTRGPASRAGLPPAPVRGARLRAVTRLVRPAPAEVERNPRARSARLRVAERAV